MPAAASEVAVSLWKTGNLIDRARLPRTVPLLGEVPLDLVPLLLVVDMDDLDAVEVDGDPADVGPLTKCSRSELEARDVW